MLDYSLTAEPFIIYLKSNDNCSTTLDLGKILKRDPEFTIEKLKLIINPEYALKN